MAAMHAYDANTKRRIEKLCGEARYFVRDYDNNKQFGRILDFAGDARGYGAVVVYPDGRRLLWGFDLLVDEVVCLGEAPLLPMYGATTEPDRETDRVTIEGVYTAHTVVPEPPRENPVRRIVGALVGISQPANPPTRRPKARPDSSGQLPQATLAKP